MPTSWGSDTVNGQLVPRAPSSAFFPLTFSSIFTGPAIYPKQGTYQVPPVMPNAMLQATGAPGQWGSAITTPSNVSESGSPWHPTKSPLLFAFGALVLGLFMLKYIHW
jgi:hypothetical protein